MHSARTTEKLRNESRLLRKAIGNLEALRSLRRGSIEHFLAELRDRLKKLKRAIATIEKIPATKQRVAIRRRVY